MSRHAEMELPVNSNASDRAILRISAASLDLSLIANTGSRSCENISQIIQPLVPLSGPINAFSVAYAGLSPTVSTFPPDAPNIKHFIDKHHTADW